MGRKTLIGVTLCYLMSAGYPRDEQTTRALQCSLLWPEHDHSLQPQSEESDLRPRFAVRPTQEASTVLYSVDRRRLPLAAAGPVAEFDKAAGVI
jgi:hypothetical protein